MKQLLESRLASSWSLVTGHWPLAITLVGVLLTGCVDVGVESTFNADGSVRHTVLGAIDRSALRQLGELGGVDTGAITDQEAARQLAEERGFEYEPIDTPLQVGAMFSKTYPDGHDIGATITDLYSATLPEEGATLPDDVFVGTFSENGDDWSFTLTIDAEEVLAVVGSEGEDDTLSPEMIDQIFDITYAATFPGTVEETSGTRLSNTRVRWNLPLSGVTTLTATGTFASAGDGSSAVVVLLVAGAFLAASGILGYWWLTPRHTTPPAAAFGASTPVVGILTAHTLDHQPHIDAPDTSLPPRPPIDPSV